MLGFRVQAGDADYDLGVFVVCFLILSGDDFFFFQLIYFPFFFFELKVEIHAGETSWC
jgi:hypothetical protein